MRTTVMMAIAFGCSGGATGAGDADVADNTSSTDGRDDEALLEGTDIPPDSALDVPVTPRNCGDGTLDPDEECDDGNRFDGDGCDWMCRLGDGEPPGPADPSSPRFTPEGEPGILEGTWNGDWLGGPSEACYRVPFMWAGDSYALVSYSRDSGARISRFDRSGRRVGMEWALPNSDAYDAAWNGSGFAVVWCSNESTEFVGTEWILILGADGKPVGDAILLARRPSESCSAAVVAWDGEGYAVFSLWNASSLRFVRTDEHGSVAVDDRLIYTADDRELQCLSGAASARTAAAAAFVSHEGGSWVGTEYSVVDRSGESLRVARVIGACNGGPPDIAWDGRQFGLLTFGPPVGVGGLHLARLSPDGDLLGPPSRLGPGASRSLALAVGLGWGAATQWLFVRADAEGRVAQRIPLDSREWTAFMGFAIGLAFDGEGFGIVGVGPGGPWFGRLVPEP
jgi:cysteine-rich repeat protein